MRLGDGRVSEQGGCLLFFGLLFFTTPQDAGCSASLFYYVLVDGGCGNIDGIVAKDNKREREWITSVSMMEDDDDGDICWYMIACQVFLFIRYAK